MVNMAFSRMAARGVHDKVLNMARPFLDNKKILVAASGEGHFEYQLLNMGVESSDIVPVDINPRQYKLEALDCCYCDLNYQLPFSGRKFDLCFAIEIIEHLRDPENLFIECHRILKPDGLLFLTTPNIHSIAQKLRFLFTGKFQWFREKDFYNLGHRNPMFDYLLKIMIKNRFEIIVYDAPKFRLKLLTKAPGLPVPMKSLLFADVNIYALRKI